MFSRKEGHGTITGAFINFTLGLLFAGRGCWCVKYMMCSDIRAQEACHCTPPCCRHPNGTPWEESTRSHQCLPLNHWKAVQACRWIFCADSSTLGAKADETCLVITESQWRGGAKASGVWQSQPWLSTLSCWSLKKNGWAVDWVSIMKGHLHNIQICGWKAFTHAKMRCEA